MSFLRLMITLMFVVIVEVSSSHPSPPGPGISFDLVHRDHILSPQHTRPERLRQMLLRDVDKRKSLLDNATALTPISPGADFGIGEYIVKLRVGTPAQEVLMVPSTASDLSFLKCGYKGKMNTFGPIFSADRSSSFTPLPCATHLCSYNLTFLTQNPKECVSIHPLRSTCAYSNYSYSGGSATSGVFAYESFRFGLTNRKATVLKHMLIGCATSGEGLEVINGTHGILGLGNSPLSFTAFASRLFGNKFSMCLADHLSSRSESSGKFVFGSVPKGLLPKTVAYTGLDTYWNVPFYALNVTGVYVNGHILSEIPAATWNVSDQNGGTIVDIGTSLTFLSKRAYGPVTSALNKYLSRSLKPVTRGEVSGSFEYCYESKGYKESFVPVLEIGFRGGARLKPFPDSYLIDIDPDTKCLGFQDAGSTLSMIGNILLQKHFVEFDIDNGRFGFGRSLCT